MSLYHFILIYDAEKDPLARMELLTEIARIDDGHTVALLNGISRRETYQHVREQAKVLVAFMAASQPRKD